MTLRQARTRNVVVAIIVVLAFVILGLKLLEWWMGTLTVYPMGW